MGIKASELPLDDVYEIYAAVGQDCTQFPDWLDRLGNGTVFMDAKRDLTGFIEQLTAAEKEERARKKTVKKARKLRAKRERNAARREKARAAKSEATYDLRCATLRSVLREQYDAKFED